MKQKKAPLPEKQPVMRLLSGVWPGREEGNGGER